MELRDVVAIRSDRIVVDMFYPGIKGGINQVEVSLMHVRAADSILIEYDFDRDGYVIKQASRFEWEDEEPDPDWQEVAFVKAWDREEKAKT